MDFTFREDSSCYNKDSRTHLSVDAEEAAIPAEGAGDPAIAAPPGADADRADASDE
ncbi:hypothetical protein [Pseudonocardia sp. TMWB2A]|uniref:hypothetical protein n=1 Tax=Pseudonocardia sp. TMWB2A TaxID=687430 RepID=UPI00307D7D12